MSRLVEFRVLGPLQVLLDTEPLLVRAGRQRALLVSLLLRAGTSVSVDELAGNVWGENPPARARATLQTYVMRLRQLLGPSVPIKTVPDGYLIDVDEKTIDLMRFEPLIEQGEQERAAGNLQAASAAFAAALGLWRGPALVDVPSEILHRDEVPRLDERRLHVLERRVEVDLELGRHGELVAELSRLTSEHPLRERFWAQLMVALYRSGRQSEALAAYQRVSRLLGDELGIDPGDELRRVHSQVLSGSIDAVARVPSGTPVATKPERVVPSQLPADIPDFVGRDEAVSLIVALLRTAQGVPVVTLAGPPGVGKTALAVHAAHRMRADFPDGQLYVNLRGYAPGPPLSAVDVLPRFLRALGTEPDQVPLDQDEQEAMFRSTLTGQRVLLLLDNASSAEQIRPLLPGSPGCAVLVTSRDTLRGLAVSHAASNVRLDVLDWHETKSLLAGILGADEVASQEDAALELAALCAHLPLALRIAAANLVSRPELSIADYVEELRAGNRLAALAVEGDERVAVHAAFDLSYTALKPELAQMFRLLSLVPGTDFTPEMAAALSGLTTQDARRRLDRLATANLISNHAPSRYQFHDLLRDYAAERLAFEEGRADSRLSLRRLLDWAVRSVDNATSAMKSTLFRFPRPAAVDSVVPRTFSTSTEALTWLDVERANLVALVAHAVERDPENSPWQLADALRGYFYTQGLTAEWRETARAGLLGARAPRDQLGQLAMLSSLGTLYWVTGQHRNALGHYLQAIALQEHIDLPEAEAAVLSNAGSVYIDLGELEHAADHLERALVITRRIGAFQVQANALFNLGGVYMQLGLLDRAASTFEEALEGGTRIDSWITQANSMRALGEVYASRGQPELGASYFMRASELYERAAARNFGHTMHEGMAITLIMRGRFEEAAVEASAAMQIARDLENVKSVCDAQNLLGRALEGAGRYAEALEQFSAALAIAVDTGYSWGICSARRGLASSYRAAGRYEEALAMATSALVEAGRSQFRLAEMEVLLVLGRTHLDMSAASEALDCALRASTVGAALGHRWVFGRALQLAGDAAVVLGDATAARAHWSTALEVFSAIGTPEASVVQAQLLDVTT
ncbi:DNA-binding transcriptional activator of the SARP family [Lentzea waywayandensis]|uniref:DNA-binding transcriptional activator of the SARP family n=1 Tax=Lentzea waywayandensis TaxID=84724 RepID=A0A1I6EEA5_9PSEU|nr:BTAD domain-containing putative transcriptional regulator [Lentzea waywayandensis]SFR16086.1 DNA-binding transcriptional activator of the SARP family [Lentzea waywayandensis]